MKWWKFVIAMIIWDIIRAIGIAFFTKYLLNKSKNKEQSK